MKKTYLMAGIAILLWSPMATISKVLLGNFDQYQVLCISALFAALALFAVNLLSGRLKKLKACRPKHYLQMLVSGLLGNFFYYAFYYAGAARLPASQAFIANYLWPIMSVVFACILLKEKLTVRKGIAFGLSFLGVITVAGGDLLRFDTQTLLGMALCAGGAVCYGAFTVLNKKWECDTLLSMMLSCGAAFLLSLLGYGTGREQCCQDLQSGLYHTLFVPGVGGGISEGNALGLVRRRSVPHRAGHFRAAAREARKINRRRTYEQNIYFLIS